MTRKIFVLLISLLLVAQPVHAGFKIKLPKIKIPNPIKVGRDAVEAVGEVAEGVVKGAGEVAGGVAKGGGEVIQGVGKGTKQVLDATVGEVFVATDDAVQTVSEPIADGVNEIGGAAGDVVDDVAGGTMDLLEEPVGALGDVVHGTMDYIQENPIEAAAIVMVVYGGYLLYANNYAFSIKIYELSIPISGGAGTGAAVTGGAIAYGVEQQKRFREEEQDSKIPTPPPTPWSSPVGTDTVLAGIPERPVGPINDQTKMDYVMQSWSYIENHPIEIYSPNSLPENLTRQEEVLLDLAITLNTFPVSEGDQMVIDRDEDGALKNIIAEATKGGIEGGPSEFIVITLGETTKEVVTPSIASDGTLLGQGHINSMKQRVGNELQKYVEMRSNGSRSDTNVITLKERKDGPSIESVQKTKRLP